MALTQADTLHSSADDPREVFGWAMYDWANSAFSATVVTVFLGPYLTSVAKAAADSDGFLYLLGIPLKYDSFFAYCTAVSVILQVLVLPVLGAIADYSHRRKFFLQLFCAVGAIATMLLFFLRTGLHWLGAGLYIVANFAFGASIVFYNAYLPDIASPAQRDQVSAYGWGLGYLGGGVLLLLNLLLFTFRDALGLSTDWAVRLSLASAGLWWLAFAQLSFVRLRSRYAQVALPSGETYLSIALRQLRQMLRKVRSLPDTLTFLMAYLFYNDGVQTVIALASVFGAEELKLNTSTLIQVILMVQFVAFLGALAFGRLARWIGAKAAIVLTLIVWSLVTVYAYQFLHTATQFWLMAVVVALVMGGSQALSRSLFSQMIPKGQEAEFFAFYEISERGTSWIGFVLFGLANQLAGSLRVGILSLIALFSIGLLILLFVNVSRGAQRANPAPIQVG
ncbi:MAG: MFS transporter [Chloroherpetonaceae bacterium]|nr:MFS transporter [Chloroherpetonaceae bacterium]